jgi:hypothetical protein
MARQASRQGDQHEGVMTRVRGQRIDSEDKIKRMIPHSQNGNVVSAFLSPACKKYQNSERIKTMYKKNKLPIPKRNIQFHFCADKEEAELIKERFATTGMVSRAAFIRKMAVKGYHITMDLSDINEIIRLLRSVNNNISQLTKVSRETQNVYAGDIEELRQQYDSLWDMANGILKGLAKIQSGQK